jgi:predicted  nucleic acid-binding Zn-ribbon protein
LAIFVRSDYQQPTNLPPHPPSLPPVRPAQQQINQTSSPERDPPVPLSALGELQSQLHDTQSSLASHIDKIRALEGVLDEHEAMKREVNSLRELMEERKREVELLRLQGSSGLRHHEDQQHDDQRDAEDLEIDDDDARSIRTILPHELERVDEEDEDQLAAEEEEEEDRRRRREELGRPRTPEPTCMGLTEEDYEIPHTSSIMSTADQRFPSPPLHSRDVDSRDSSVIDELTRRLSSLSDRLESALELSTNLQAQHAAAQSTISALESKVSALELLVQTTRGQVQAQMSAQEAAAREIAAQLPSQKQVQERESLTQMLNEWKKSVEGQWSTVKEEWTQERERLSKAREEWENKVKVVETGLGFTAAKVDSALASLVTMQNFQYHRILGNGNVKHSAGSGGLVTPPSPRSLSSDSNRPRHRRKRSSSSRGRSRSLPQNMSNAVVAGDLTEDSNSSVASTSGLPSVFSKSRPYSPSLSISDDPGYLDVADQTKLTAEEAARSLATPDPSVQLSSSHSTLESSKSNPPVTSEEIVCVSLSQYPDFSTDLHGQHPLNLSTAMGVLVLSVAAAAVLWRVKPE